MNNNHTHSNMYTHTHASDLVAIGPGTHSESSNLMASYSYTYQGASINSKSIKDEFSDAKLDQVIQAFVYLMIQKGVIVDVQEFKNMVLGIKTADKLSE